MWIFNQNFQYLIKIANFDQKFLFLIRFSGRGLQNIIGHMRIILKVRDVKVASTSGPNWPEIDI